MKHLLHEARDALHPIEWVLVALLAGIALLMALKAAPAYADVVCATLPCIAVPGWSFSPRAYLNADGTMNGTPPIANAVHQFVMNDAGCLEHWMNGALRATVPPEGVSDYADVWPDCKPIADQVAAADALHRRDAPAPVPEEPARQIIPDALPPAEAPGA